VFSLSFQVSTLQGQEAWLRTWINCHVWVVVMMLENMWCLSSGRNLWTEIVGHVMQFRTTGHHPEMGIVVWVGRDKGDLALI
jgi:hypothetical protein